MTVKKSDLSSQGLGTVIYDYDSRVVRPQINPTPSDLEQPDIADRVKGKDAQIVPSEWSEEQLTALRRHLPPNRDLTGVIVKDGLVTHAVNWHDSAPYDPSQASTRAFAALIGGDAFYREDLRQPVPLGDFVKENADILPPDLKRTLSLLAVRPESISTIPERGKGV